MCENDFPEEFTSRYLYEEGEVGFSASRQHVVNGATASGHWASGCHGESLGDVWTSAAGTWKSAWRAAEEVDENKERHVGQTGKAPSIRVR